MAAKVVEHLYTPILCLDLFCVQGNGTRKQSQRKRHPSAKKMDSSDQSDEAVKPNKNKSKPKRQREEEHHEQEQVGLLLLLLGW